MYHRFNPHTLRTAIAGSLCSLVLLIAGCAENDHDQHVQHAQTKPSPENQQLALIATAGDYGSKSGAHALIATDAPYDSLINLAPTSTTDIAVACQGNALYRLEKFGRNSITKFSLDAPATHQWQYSVSDAQDTQGGQDFSNSNPYDILTVSDTKAYVIRYGSPLVWIVNPSATSGANFKTGVLDLSAYADADGVPEVASGVIVDGKLFLVMQRLDTNKGWLPGAAYVAVYDTTTDQEIDTGTSIDTKGILLPVTDPGKILYMPANDTLYVQAIGKYAGTLPAKYDGGIVTVNPHFYLTNLLVNDGDADTHPYGNIIELALVSPDKGYFVGYATWQDTSLYAFNPTTGEVNATPIAGLQNIDISDINVDASGKLWVGRPADFGITLIDTTTDQITEALIPTGLSPIQIEFCRK